MLGLPRDFTQLISCHGRFKDVSNMHDRINATLQVSFYEGTIEHVALKNVDWIFDHSAAELVNSTFFFKLETSPFLLQTHF